MKHLDPRRRTGYPALRISRLQFLTPSRLWLSEALLRALTGAWGSIPAGNLVGLDRQSKRFFAWLNCGSGMPVPAFLEPAKDL
jgi:hypothetical protein